MSWTKLRYGRHTGKTFPQILFSDPDWLFWAVEEGPFAKKKTFLAREAADIDRKARNIRIPSRLGEDLVVEYFIHRPTGKFIEFRIVPADQPYHEGSSPTFRGDVIDLSIPRKISSYDKLGYKSILASLKFYIFRTSKTRMTKEKCEEFYDDPTNFL